MSSGSLGEVSILERPAGKLHNAKLFCGLTLALVFLAGAVAGAVAMDLRVHSRTRPLAFDTAEGKALAFDRIQKELDLTPAQSEQMKSVLEDFWQYYRNVVSGGKQQVEQLLTPEQRRKFERMLQQSAR
jgi:Spy/CpxP family protein refolding chaperone